MMTAAQLPKPTGPGTVNLLSSAGTMKVSTDQALAWMIGRTIYIGQPQQTTAGNTPVTFNLDTKIWGSLAGNGYNYSQSAVAVGAVSGASQAFIHSGYRQPAPNGTSVIVNSFFSITPQGIYTTKTAAPTTVSTTAFAMAGPDNFGKLGKWGGYPFGNVGMQLYNLADDTWSTSSAPGTANERRLHGMTYYNRNFYIIGGIGNPYAFPTSILVWSNATGAWTTIVGSSLNALAYISPVVINGFIYIFGGFTINNVWTNTLLKYDIANNVWYTVALSLTLPNIASPCVVSDGTLLYVYEPSSGKLWSIAV